MIEKIDKYVPISNAECEKLWREIVDKFNNNLARYSVSLPGEDSCKKYQLIYLYKYMGCCVHKDVVSEFVSAHVENAAKDQQVRHLAADGFNVLNRGEQIVNTSGTVPSGYNMLQTLDFPKSAFMAAVFESVISAYLDEFDV